MRDASPDIETAPVLGALQLLKRKTGEVASHIALNADRATLGRERDCDIRLYFPDVSKLHAEIVFNEDSGAANLVVHGNNGLIYTPTGGAAVKLVPPAVTTLNDGDTFQIRQKLFRFVYGDSATSNGYQTPAKPAVESPARRRQSHRLSIVPLGKRFAPSPAKMRPFASTPGRSGLSKEVEIEEDANEPLIFDELVDVAEGDEGDKVYLEKREEAEPIFNHPFMTPQQPKRRAELRNTSAVPRTRTLTFAIPDKSALACDAVSDSNSEEEEMEMEDEGVDEEVPVNDAASEERSEDGESEDQENELPQIPASPRTPRSIPLPTPSDTPYSGPMGSPRRPIVTPRSGYATNRGAPDSLRKALLLRSARRAYEASLPTGIEEEIDRGHIEVRRRRSMGRKTLSPPKAASDSDSSEASSEEDEDKENAPQQLRWVYENGQAEVSQFDDSDSDRESFDMDFSIPGQGVIDFHAAHEVNSASESEEYVSEDDANEHEHEGQYEDEDGDQHGLGDDAAQVYAADESLEDRSESDSGSEVSDGELSADEPADDGQQVAEVDEVGNMSSDIDDEVDRSLICSPEEMDERKSPSPILPSRFYTPQPERKVYGGARMSLAGIGGPSMRFAEQHSPPSSSLQTETRNPPTPGRLGKPVRVVYKSPAAKLAAEEGRDVEGDDDDDSGEEAISATSAAPHKSAVPATPLKTPGVAAAPLRTPGTGLTKEQREQLGTPLALPPAPAESFRDSVPRLQPTPRRGSSFLEALRQSVQNSAKKAQDRNSVAFDVPETPSRAPKTPSANLAASIRRRQVNTPRVESIDEGESESFPPTPTHVEPAQDLVEKAEAALDADMAQTPQEPSRARRRSLPSPSLSGLRDMLKPPKAPKTPSMAGVRDLFKTPKAPQTPALDGVRELMREPKHAKTPSFAGMREMFRTQAVPPTPAMGGMREMFALPAAQATPAMEGVADMFPDVAPERNEEDEDDEKEEDERSGEDEASGAEKSESEAEPPAETSAPTSPEKKKQPSRSKVPTRTIPARTTRAASRSRSESAAPEPETASEPAVGKPRTRRAKDEPKANPEAASQPTRPRLRGKASVEDAPSLPSRRAVSAPTRRVTRSTTAEPESEPAAAGSGTDEERETRSAPTRRSRRVLGEAEQRKVSAPSASAAPAKKPAARKASAAKEKEKEREPASAPAARARSASAAAPAATTKTAAKTSKTAKTTTKTTAAASTEDKENSATPDPEPKRRVTKKASASALPVRVTRSRKA